MITSCWRPVGNNSCLSVKSWYDTLMCNTEDQSRSTPPVTQLNEGRRTRTTVPRLAEQIRSHLAFSNYDSGDRYLTIREIVDRWRVSPVTAHRSVRMLSDQGILEVRGGAGTFVAGSLAGCRPRLVQVAHLFAPSEPDMQDRVMRERLTHSGLQTGIMDVLPTASIQLHFLPPRWETTYLDEVFGPGTSTTSTLGSFLFRVPRCVRLYFVQHRLPAVVVGHTESDLCLPNIDRDQRCIARTVALRLFSRGHRRFGLLMRDSWNPGDDQLIESFQQFAAEAALDGYGLQIRSMTQEHSLIRATVAQLLSVPNRPTALVCRTDLISIVALEATLAAGLRVPEDVAIIGTGAGIHPAMADGPVPITTMCTDDREVGRGAAELLRDIMKGTRPAASVVRLESRLIERNSG
jgi:hypothetical protein